MMKINENLIKDAVEVDFFSMLSEEEKAHSRLLVDIATAIKNKRIELGYTQKEFAKYMSVTQSLVSKWEGYSKNFNLKKLLSLLEKLDLEFRIEPKLSAQVCHSKQAVSALVGHEASMPIAAVSGGSYNGAKMLPSSRKDYRFDFDKNSNKEWQNNNIVLVA